METNATIRGTVSRGTKRHLDFVAGLLAESADSITGTIIETYFEQYLIDRGVYWAFPALGNPTRLQARARRASRGVR